MQYMRYLIIIVRGWNMGNSEWEIEEINAAIEKIKQAYGGAALGF